jgi:hypothetical protein
MENSRVSKSATKPKPFVKRNGRPRERERENKNKKKRVKHDVFLGIDLLLRYSFQEILEHGDALLHDGPSLLKLYHFALIVPPEKNRFGPTEPMTYRSRPPLPQFSESSNPLHLTKPSTPNPQPSPSPSSKQTPPKRLLTRLPLRAYTIHKHTDNNRHIYMYK